MPTNEFHDQRTESLMEILREENQVDNDLLEEIDQQQDRNLEYELNENTTTDMTSLEHSAESFPNYLNLLPEVRNPTQQHSIEDIVRDAAGDINLDEIHDLQLRLITCNINLMSLGTLVRNLQCLDLTGSIMCSISDLGYSLENLSDLIVTNCGLTNLNGIQAFPILRSLIADDNMIERIDYLSSVPVLQTLSLRNNRIADLRDLNLMNACQNLMELDLSGNSVCYTLLYRATIIRMIPSLNILDSNSILEQRNNTPEGSDEEENDDSISSGFTLPLSSELDDSTSASETEINLTANH